LAFDNAQYCGRCARSFTSAKRTGTSRASGLPSRRAISSPSASQFVTPELTA